MIFSIAARLFGPQLSSLVPNDWMILAKITGVLAFLFMFWNMIVTTLIGLYYLTDRIHWPDTSWKPPAEEEPLGGDAPNDEPVVYRAPQRQR